MRYLWCNNDGAEKFYQEAAEQYLIGEGIDYEIVFSYSNPFKSIIKIPEGTDISGVLTENVKEITKDEAVAIIEENFHAPSQDHPAAGLIEFGAIPKEKILNKIV